MLFSRIKNIAERYFIFFPIGFAVAVLAAGLLFHTTGSYHIDSENDFFNSYVPHAEKFLNGNLVVDDFRGPLYIIVLAVIKSFVGDYLQSGIVISSVSAGVFLFFIYKSALLFFHSQKTIFIILFTAFNPHFVKFSYGAGTDMFCLALISGGLYYFFKGGGKREIIISAVFLALAFLTRYNSALFLVLVPGMFLLDWVRKRERTMIYKGVLFVVTAAVISIPWGLYTQERMGEFFYNKNYKNIALSMNNGFQFDWEEAWRSKGEEYNSLSELVKGENINLVKSVAANFFIQISKDLLILIDWLWAPFILAGFVFMVKKREKKEVYFLFPFLAYLLSLLIVFYSTRFSFFLLPLYGLIAYNGIIWFLEIINRRFIRSGGYVFPSMLLFTLISAIWYNAYIITPPELNKVLAALKSNNVLMEGEKLAAMRPHLAYHLGMKWEVIPYERSLETSMKELKRKKIDYLFIGKAEVEKRKYLEKLREPSNAPVTLKPVVYLPKEAIILYKIIY
jgi:hypothetical protein